MRCRCEKCPHDIGEVFPGKTICYESGFSRTACKWHWLIKGRYGTVQIDGLNSLWVEVTTRRLKSCEEDWQDVTIIRSEGAGQPNEILKGVKWYSSFRVPMADAKRVSQLLKL